MRPGSPPRRRAVDLHEQFVGGLTWRRLPISHRAAYLVERLTRETRPRADRRGTRRGRRVLKPTAKRWKKSLITPAQ